MKKEIQSKVETLTAKNQNLEALIVQQSHRLEKLERIALEHFQSKDLASNFYKLV